MKMSFPIRLIGGSAMLALAGMFAQASEEGAKAGFDLVRDGEARAAVVVAREATPTAEFAARELIDHVERATGVTLPLAREGAVPEGYAHRVYVGPTEAAARRGIDYEALPPDAYIIRTDKGDLFMGGAEREWFDPLAVYPPEPMDRTSERNMTYGGTTRAVYAFLRRAAGVRWIWPGDLGTYVPSRETLRAEAWDVRESPFFGLRKLRNTPWKQPPPSFATLTNNQTKAHKEGRQLFFKRHGMGASSYVTRGSGHFFGHAWNAVGKEHPEWFAVGRDGKRPEWRGAEEERKRKLRPVMCVSAPGLHDALVEHQGLPGVRMGRHFGEQYIMLTGVDNSQFCWGERCMSWDGPQPEIIRNTPGNRVVSDRYAKFWKLVHSRFAEDHPDIITNVYLYWQTFHAPTTDIQLNENIHAKFAPWRNKTMWIPMPEEDLEWVKEQWRGWRETGITMAYRPNFPHSGGYVLPFADSRQTGEMIQWVAENGSVGVEIDSIFGNWSTRGPMLYVLARMIDEPGSDVERLRAEYFEAFGPAADQIEAYFDYWEAYSRQLVREENWPLRGVRGMLGAPEHYGENIFEPAARLLDEALSRADNSDNPRFAERVRFVGLGLENARLSMAFLRTLEDGQVVRHDRERFEAARNAWRKVRGFRREHSTLPFIGFEDVDYWEAELLDDPKVLERPFEEARTEPPVPKRVPWEPWRIRPDPDNRGVQEGWFREAGGRDAWRPVEVPAFWADALGEESDVEHAWYRTRFYMPEDWGGDDLRLTFDGVDEQAWVYVNGELVGEHTVDSEGVPPAVLWDRPFSVDVPGGDLRTDGPNHLFVRVKNEEKAAGIHGEVRGFVPFFEGEIPLPVWESAHGNRDGRD